MSIAKWASQVLENTVKKGFYEQAVKTVRELLARQGGASVTVGVGAQEFEDMLKECQEISRLALSGDD